MTIEDIQKIISTDETRILELKKSTGELKDGMHSACAFLNTDGGWLIFGIAPTSLKIIGQQVTDNTRQEIGNAIAGLEPAIDVKVEYIPVPDAKNDEKIIAMHFNCWKYGDMPYTYHGCPYIRIESTTKVMPREMYDERLRASDPQKFGWENRMASGVTLADIDENRVRHAVRLGVERGRILEAALTEPIEQTLEKWKIVKDSKPTNAAVALFSKNLDEYPQLLMRMARFRGTDKNEFIDSARVYGNFFDLMDAGVSFLFKHLSQSGVIKNLKREEQLEIPITALREGLINSLCHRQYDLPGDSVSLAVYDDRVEITNPGHFTHGITAESIKQPHDSHPYNPAIANVLYLSTYLESWGSGAKRIMDECREHGVENPVWEESMGCVKIIFKRPDTTMKPTSNRHDTDMIPTSSPHDKVILSALISGEQHIASLMELCGYKDRASFRKSILTPMIEKGWVEMTLPNSPKSKNQRYRISKVGIEILNSFK